MKPCDNISHISSHHEIECGSLKKRSKADLLINIIEKISAVVLGVFSAYTCWKLFVPFFFLGCGIGIYTFIKAKKSCDHSHPVSACANGFLEQLTGVKLPKIASLAANIAVTICHIDHHAVVFVPVVGVSLGAWIGKTSSHYGILLYKKINVYYNSKYSLSNRSASR